jgi:4-alpha-glucanotransferase
MSRFGVAARDRDCGLYLDFPLGSNAHGFDVWHEERLFVRAAAIGAPPDLAYSTGQNWGFRPPHPDEFRRDGYRHFAACLRQQMQVASVLRLDHVMGLHRMYWVPDGFPPDQGVYVSNHAEELYAVLAIESQRSGCEVVGEDLGTVPATVRSTMKRTGVKRLFVLQRQLAHLLENPPGEIYPEMVASINTHDMHPFAAFWSGADIEEKLDLGVIPAVNRERELQRREEGRRALLAYLTRNGFLAEGEEEVKTILRATLEWLAGSRASIVLLNLEDLWLETVAQNVPTTTFQRPNWRPRLKRSLEQLAADGAVNGLLALVNERQKSEGRRQK